MVARSGFTVWQPARRTLPKPENLGASPTPLLQQLHCAVKDAHQADEDKNDRCEASVFAVIGLCGGCPGSGLADAFRNVAGRGAGRRAANPRVPRDTVAR